MRTHDPNAVEYQSVLALWDQWTSNRVEVIAPALLRFEVTNALYRSAKYGLISVTEATETIRSLSGLPIRYFDDQALNMAAFEIARSLDLKAADDAHYVALALREGAGFFTVDKRLVNATQPTYSFVHYAMEP